MKNQPQTRHTFVNVNGSYTHVVQYGSAENIIKLNCSQQTSSEHSSNDYNNKNEIFGKDSSPSLKKVVIFLPGNPGILGLYHDFICQIYNRPDPIEQPTIVAISHNNFDHPDLMTLPIKEQVHVGYSELNFVERSVVDTYGSDPHHIELQVLNKLIILKRLLRVDLEEAKLVFFGHSIGCYIILRLLQDRLVATAHEGSILIHPALENLALTEKGSRIDKIFKFRLDLLAQPFAFCLDKLIPMSMKKSLVRWMCGNEFIQHASDTAIESVIQLVSRKSLVALFQMAKSELENVKNMNTEYMIKPHADKLKLIYAVEDHWVNTHNRVQLKKLFPKLYLEEQDTQHAFIMDNFTVKSYSNKITNFISGFFGADSL